MRFNLEPESNLRDSRYPRQQPTHDAAEPAKVPPQENGTHELSNQRESETAPDARSPADGSTLEDGSQPAVLILDIEDPDSVLDVEVQLSTPWAPKLSASSSTHNPSSAMLRIRIKS